MKNNEEKDKINDIQSWFENEFHDTCGYTLFFNIITYVHETCSSKSQAELALNQLVDGIGLNESDIEHILNELYD